MVYKSINYGSRHQLIIKLYLYRLLYLYTSNLCSVSKYIGLQTFGIRALGSIAWVIPLSITISTFGSANGTLFAAGRLCFAASREGHLMNVLSYIHIKKLTPMPSIIFHVSNCVVLPNLTPFESENDFEFVNNAYK